MGAYLSSPVCDKETIDGSNDRLAFAASSMQGWRMSQEDAHNAILDYDKQTSLFAVYDGHGGAEIALYCSRQFPEFLKHLETYRNGDFQAALTEGFLKFDSLLLEPSVKEVLQKLAEEKDNEDEEDGDQIADGDDANEDEDEQSEAMGSSDTKDQRDRPEELNVEEAQILKKEATLPIEELLKQYGDKANDQGKHFHSPHVSKRKAQVPVKNLDKTKDIDIKVQNADQNDSSVKASDADLNKTEPVEKEEETTDIVIDNSETKDVEIKINGDVSESSEQKPSSSEVKSTERKARKSPVVTSDDTDTSSTKKKKSESLIHHLLSGDNDQMDENDEDEDDSEFIGSEEETSEDEDEDDEEESAAETDEDNEDNEDDDDEQETEEEEGDENEGKSNSRRTAQMQKLMKKSIMAILHQRLKKKKRSDDSDEEAKENEAEGDENGDDDDYEDEDDEDDDGDDAELGKMLDVNNDPGSSSGCTAVVALLHEKQLFVANAGDSRCVVCRAGRAVEMSIDHKPEDPQERLRIEKAGYKVTMDGRVSGGLNLSRAIGDHAYKKTTSLPPEEQAITALPDIRKMTLDDQDEFMIIACDGIWNFMSSEDAVTFVRERLGKKSLSQICEELFMHCLAPNTSGDGTGCDNMTAIIVKFNFNSSTKGETDENSPVLNSRECSPWPTMFTPVNNKRALSPDHTSSSEIGDENTSKKVKLIENRTVEMASPTKTSETFSFTAATANINNNNSSDDPQH